MAENFSTIYSDIAKVYIADTSATFDLSAMDSTATAPTIAGFTEIYFVNEDGVTVTYADNQEDVVGIGGRLLKKISKGKRAKIKFNTTEKSVENLSLTLGTSITTNAADATSAGYDEITFGGNGVQEKQLVLVSESNEDGFYKIIHAPVVTSLGAYEEAFNASAGMITLEFDCLERTDGTILKIYNKSANPTG